jgi:hypothetical protein
MTDPTAAPVPAAPATAGGTSGLAIAGIIIDFVIAPLGLILSIVAKSQARKAGLRSTVATVGIVLGIVFTVGDVIAIISLVGVFASIASECAQLGQGVHQVGGTTYTCS